MIGLDTNVVIRHLVQDDQDQSQAASALMDTLTETEPGYLSVIAVVEVYWVLRRAYRISAERCVELLSNLVDTRELRIDQESVVRAALDASDDGLEFPDAVIAELGHTAGCHYTMTFDRPAARTGRMRLMTF